MNYRKSIYSGHWAVLALLLVSGTVAAGDVDGPIWPLDLEPHYLTSNFMEHRPGRFHAGLDFKTDERSGHTVRAVTDGWISRIRFTAGGYGKALYLRGDDGLTYVYAHLERLADSIRPLVEQAQRRQGSWSVALQFPAGKHPVRSGDVLALSGQSGTSGPHLHFEVRDGANHPRDPQAWGFAVADDIPPRLLRVRAIPAAPGATVDGGPVARAVGDGVSALGPDLGVVGIHGAVAFTCQVVEVSDVRGHRLEPWRLALTVDDSLIFESRNESFAFERNDCALLMWLETPEGRERWLHVNDGDNLEGRTGTAWWADPTVMTPGAHVFDLTAEDRAGNRAQTSWTVLVDRDPSDPTWRDASLRSDLDPPAEGVAWLAPFLVGLTSGEVIAAESLCGLMQRPMCAVVDSFAFEAATISTLKKTQGLIPLQDVLRVHAAQWPTTASLTVATGRTDSLPPHTGCYVETSRGWRLVGDAHRSGVADAEWVVEVGGRGRFALMRDENAPYLGPGPEEGIVRSGGAAGVSGVTPPHWETISVRLEDLGSGISAETIAAVWDGAPLIVEPDLPRNRILVTVPDDAPAGIHLLKLGAADRAGHEIERIYELRLVSE